MLETAFTSILSFIGTNIDDLFVLTFLYLQAENAKSKFGIVAGRYIGLALILALSALAAFGLGFLNEKYLGLLGVVPILLGVKEWIAYRRSKKRTEEQEKTEIVSENEKRGKFPLVLSTALLSVSNGADNVGVYVPLMTGFTSAQLLLFIGIFLVMTAIWCFFSARLVRLPFLKVKLEKYKPVLVPVVFIALGVYIFLKAYL